jgi:hypothetical protein
MLLLMFERHSHRKPGRNCIPLVIPRLRARVKSTTHALGVTLLSDAGFEEVAQLRMRK